MITLEEARAYYPRDQCPPDEELQRLLSFFYWVAESEYDLILQQRNNERK